MTFLRAHIAAWLLGLSLRCMPPHPYKTAMIATMAEHGRQWWRVWRAETAR